MSKKILTNEVPNLSIVDLLDLANQHNPANNEIVGIFDELNSDRYSSDISYMMMAYDWANRSKAIRKAVGALVVQNKKIIADGYNGMPKGLGDVCDIITIGKDGQTELATNPLVLHAEHNCFSKLAASSEFCRDATIYVTLSPCLNCANKIVSIMTPDETRAVKRVVYHEKYRLEEFQQVTALFNAVGIEVVHLKHPDLDKKKAEVEAKRMEIMSEYFPHLSFKEPPKLKTNKPR